MQQGMNDVLGRSSIAIRIIHILQTFEEQCQNVNFKKGIYIYGPPGCGKTRFISDILTSLNYDIVKFDAGDVRNKALIDSLTCDSISTHNVLEMMHRRKKRIAILMKEVEALNGADRNCITHLIKLIRQKRTKKQKTENVTLNPIICLGNYYTDKKIKELMKVCNVFELKPISNSQMRELCHIRMPMLKTKITEDMIRYIQGDLRKLEFIEKLLMKKPNVLNDPELLKNILHLKSYNDNAKETTRHLLQTYIPLESHSNYMNETDRTTIALLYHENIVDVLTTSMAEQDGSCNSNRTSFPIEFYLKVLENICFADHIDRITFQNQIWVFNEMSSLIKTFYNNYLFHEQYKHMKKEMEARVPKEIRFTKILTKYSTEYNNQLFIYNWCQELDMDKKDVCSLFQELRLFYGKQYYKQNDLMEQVMGLFEETSMQKLDVKRMYRYLDKNVKPELLLEEYDEELV